MYANNAVEPGQALEIQAHMDALALLLGQRPAATRAGWVMYLLETMEAGDGTLAELQAEIGDRLAAGEWPADMEG